MITFIVPTINRNSLNTAINSLLSQTNPNWNAIIVFDGIPALNYNDDRISCISIPKCGKSNHAGLVRNEAIKLVKTDWIGFLDDDDTIDKEYVNKFFEEININADAECIIFRMHTKFDRDKILPAPHHNDFYKNKVGISFCFNKRLNLLFEPSTTEDFYLLDKIRELNHKMIISPYVTYFVRSSPVSTDIYNRVKINYL
jgi:glycosyltransferase involved in cell wall biosynthesis